VLTHNGDDDTTSGLDDITTYYLLHRHDFGLAEAPIGACILYALSCNLSDGDLADRFDILARSGRTLLDELQDSDEEADPEGADTAEDEAGGGGSKVKLKAWDQRRAKWLGFEGPGNRPVPLIDQAHRLMHLWRAGDEAKVNDYLDTRGLKRNALFSQLLQALIELSPAGSDERSILESLSNHIVARGGITAPRQTALEV
jgi:putative DNA methylase